MCRRAGAPRSERIDVLRYVDPTLLLAVFCASLRTRRAFPLLTERDLLGLDVLVRDASVTAAIPTIDCPAGRPDDARCVSAAVCDRRCAVG
jgi:hypothetical protein